MEAHEGAMHGGQDPVKVRVIACGNSLMGNDGAGPAVMALLAKEHPELDVVDGGSGGLGLIPLMEGCDRVILVDATSGLGSPGEVQVFHGVPAGGIPSLSLHELGIPEVLGVAGVLGIRPEVVIVGIEGGEIPGFSPDLDPAVAAALPLACRRVVEEAGRE